MSIPAPLLYLATRIPSSLCFPYASPPFKTHSPSTTPRSYQASMCQKAENLTCILPSLIHSRAKSYGGNVNSERRKLDIISLEFVEPSSPNWVDNCGRYRGRERWRGSYHLQGGRWWGGSVLLRIWDDSGDQLPRWGLKQGRRGLVCSSFSRSFPFCSCVVSVGAPVVPWHLLRLIFSWCLMLFLFFQFFSCGAILDFENTDTLSF